MGAFRADSLILRPLKTFHYSPDMVLGIWRLWPFDNFHLPQIHPKAPYFRVRQNPTPEMRTINKTVLNRNRTYNFLV